MLNVSVIFPGDDAVLSTSVIQTVTINTESPAQYANRLAKIQLIYDVSNKVVPGMHKNDIPDTMTGSDYYNGVRIGQDGCATFKIKVLALSSQHEHTEFRFEVVVDATPIQSFKSCSFRTLSKPNRKRKSDSIELLETLADVFNTYTTAHFITDDMLESVDATNNLIVEKTKQLTSLQNELSLLHATLAKQIYMLQSHSMITKATPQDHEAIAIARA